MEFVAVKFVHLTSLLFLFCASLYKNILISSRPITQSKIYRAVTADKISGAAAGLMLVSGLAMVFMFGRSLETYIHNDFFLAKMSLFAIASILVVYTKFFLRKNGIKDSQALVTVPLSIVSVLRFDLVGLLILVFLGLSMVNLAP